MRHVLALIVVCGIARADIATPTPHGEPSEVRDAKAMTAVGTSLLCTSAALVAIGVGLVADGLWVEGPKRADLSAQVDGIVAFGLGVAAILPMVIGTALVATGVRRLGRSHTVQAAPGGLAVRF